MKKQLQTREEIHFLVTTFYLKIRKEQVLGPIFNDMIHDWEPHIEKLTDFWESNLLFFTKTRFHGDPAKAHTLVDDHLQNSLTMEHFGIWLHHWIHTIEENFEGENAVRAKNLARKMSTFLFLKIVENRKAKTSDITL